MTVKELIEALNDGLNEGIFEEDTTVRVWSMGDGGVADAEIDYSETPIVFMPVRTEDEYAEADHAAAIRNYAD